MKRVIIAVLFVVFCVGVAFAETPTPTTEPIPPAPIEEVVTPAPTWLELALPFVALAGLAVLAWAMSLLARSIPQAAIGDIIYEVGQAVGQLAINRALESETELDDNAVLWALTSAGYTVVKTDEGRFTVEKRAPASAAKGDTWQD